MKKINFYTAHRKDDEIYFKPAEGYLTIIMSSSGNQFNIAIHKLSSGWWGATDIQSGISVSPHGSRKTKKEIMCDIEEECFADKIEKAISCCKYYDECVNKIKELIEQEQNFVAHLFTQGR